MWSGTTVNCMCVRSCSSLVARRPFLELFGFVWYSSCRKAESHFSRSSDEEGRGGKLRK